MPQPRHSDLHRFCSIDGWEETTKGARNPDHTRYRKVLDDGSVLRTRVSHGRGSIEDPALWRHIWQDQLGLGSEQQFWDAISSGQAVDRTPAPTPAPTGPTKPAWLVQNLIFVVGLTEEEVIPLSEDEAMKRWLDFCTSKGSQSQ